jgi:hypothetical protein
MASLPKLIERFIRVTERFLNWEHLCRVTEGVIVLSYKLANERRDCPPDNSQEHKDLAKYQRKTLSARKAFDKIGRVLTAELERHNENSTDLFRLLNNFNAGGGGAAVANPLWQSLKPYLQRIAIRAAIPASKPKQPEENVSERLPQTDAEADILKPAIAGLLRTIPETWAEFEPDKLTATESTALFLLGATGLVERRCRLRLRMLNHPTMFEATFTATGERGAVDALKPLTAVLWGEWQDAYRAWISGDRADVVPVHCEGGKPDEWRLTDQGILARGDFDGTKPNANPDDACDFILKRGVYGPGYWIWKATFWGLTEDDKQTIQNHRNVGHDTTRLPRPAVCGSGSLIEYRKVESPTASQAVTLTNWGEGADDFATAFGNMLGPMFEAMSKGQQGAIAPTLSTSPATPREAETGDSAALELPPCPGCGGPLEKEDLQDSPDLVRPCRKCRSTEGMFTELWRDYFSVQNGAAKPDLLRRYPEWPAIQHCACEVFGHAAFTSQTWERLENWLLAEHVETHEAMHRMPRADVLRLLRAAVERTKAGFAAIAPAAKPERGEGDGGTEWSGACTPSGGLASGCHNEGLEIRKVFISYSHDSPEHCEHVLRLANALRSHGVDVELDRYNVRPPEGWPQWCEKQLRPENSGFVLMIWTETYRRRVEDKVPADEGHGVFWEGGIIYAYIYSEKGNTRFIPVLLPGATAECISIPIRNHTRYQIGRFDLTDVGYEGLYRELTKQPAVTKPALGQVVPLKSDPTTAIAAPLAPRPIATTFLAPIFPQLPERAYRLLQLLTEYPSGIHAPERGRSPAMIEERICQLWDECEVALLTELGMLSFEECRPAANFRFVSITDTGRACLAYAVANGKRGRKGARSNRLREIAAEIRLLPQVLGDMYGHREVMSRGAELLLEAYKAGAFRGGSPLAELGLRIRHYRTLHTNPENIAVQMGKKPEWRPHVWYDAVHSIVPEVFDQGDEEICLACGPIADAIEREAAWRETKPSQRTANADAVSPATVRTIPIAFISSTSEDLQEYRDKARDAALRAEFMPRMMEYFAASGEHPPLKACLAKIAGSSSERPADVLVVIVAHRYGWVPQDQPGSERKSITWLECEKAKENGKEILGFLVDEKHSWAADSREENRLAQAAKQGKASPELMAEVQENVTRLRQFKTWLDSLGIRATFTTPDSLMAEVIDALRSWKQRHGES